MRHDDEEDVDELRAGVHVPRESKHMSMPCALILVEIYHRDTEITEKFSVLLTNRFFS
jgi:hypothetical protein